MPPIFNQIVYFHCDEPLEGALQMAIDEMLLAESDPNQVVLRDYTWSEETNSIGYFGFSREVPSDEADAKPLVRRPTGGGLVAHGHGQDFTYSILIGAAQARQLQLSPPASYRAIHGILAQTLGACGIEATLASDGELGQTGGACFVNPVGDDLMSEGHKLAGAGQKRSRGTILHQGSVQPVELPNTFGLAFAEQLAEHAQVEELSSGMLAKAEALAEKKYRQAVWTHRR
ncbi:MAG: lipoate-protein ligase A [Pseudoalteromonas tetraodonis]|jgi:lipoate-protein ligase A